MRYSLIVKQAAFRDSGTLFGCAKFLWWLLELLVGNSEAGYGQRITNNEERTTKAWHIRRDWSFTPFVVVVGSKYFLPTPVCLLFDRATVGSRLWLRPIPPRHARGGFDAWPQ